MYQSIERYDSLCNSGIPALVVWPSGAKAHTRIFLIVYHKNRT